MTKGIYTHIKSSVDYELLADDIENKDNDSRMVLYCLKGCVNGKWYVRSIDYFQKTFKFKEKLA